VVADFWNGLLDGVERSHASLFSSGSFPLTVVDGGRLIERFSFRGVGVPFSPPRGGQETEVGFPLCLLQPTSHSSSPQSALPELPQKHETRGEHLLPTGSDKVVRLPSSEEANSSTLCHRPSNTVLPDGAFDVVAHG
jgi:hypothetical protein